MKLGKPCLVSTFPWILPTFPAKYCQVISWQILSILAKEYTFMVVVTFYGWFLLHLWLIGLLHLWLIFITFMVDGLLHLWLILHLWSIFITFMVNITLWFYYIYGWYSYDIVHYKIVQLKRQQSVVKTVVFCVEI